MLRYLISYALGLWTLGGLTAGAATAGGPKVVVSIKPLHSLVAGVMGELGEPFLLVRAAGSPHSYALRPSEARALDEADVVVWVGPDLEQFLVKPLTALAGQAKIVELAEAEGVVLLETREGGAWEAREEEQEGDGHQGHAGEHEEHVHGDYNMHLWLDPGNAKAAVVATVAALSDRDPDNAATYRKNGENLIARIESLDDELAGELAAIKHRPYVVFHDAYQYFEQHYGLNAVGAITFDPERAPGARRLAELRGKLETLGAACIFSEPQFEPALVETLVEGLSVKTGVLDPLGADLPAGEGAYFSLMHGLSSALVACLAPNG